MRIGQNQLKKKKFYSFLKTPLSKVLIKCHFTPIFKDDIKHLIAKEQKPTWAFKHVFLSVSPGKLLLVLKFKLKLTSPEFSMNPIRYCTPTKVPLHLCVAVCAVALLASPWDRELLKSQTTLFPHF